MQIHHGAIKEKFNYTPEQENLFKAMSSGWTIKSIRCMAGSMNKDKPEKDWKIENFKATDYWVAMQQNYDGDKKFDYVDTTAKERLDFHTGEVTQTKEGNNTVGFYMNWVREYEIEEPKNPIELAKGLGRIPEMNTPCRTAKKIAPNKECDTYFVSDKNIECRKPSTNGKFVGIVPGGGGDLWWIEHEDKTVGAYVYTDIEDRKPE